MKDKPKEKYKLQDKEREEAFKAQEVRLIKTGVKRKGWIIPDYGFLDFKEPVTYEEAKETAMIFREIFKNDKTK